MAREDLIQAEGEVVEVLAGGNFKVKLTNGQVISAKLSGKMRKFYSRVMAGDRVTIGLSPYDPTHGLIQFRHRVERRPPNSQR